MSPKKIKTSIIEKSDAGNYWQRAQELLESMKNNLVLEKWNAAVIDGVHAAISTSDALTVAMIGRRSTSDHHIDAAELLKRAVPPDLKPEIARLRRILHIKSHVEYGPSLVTDSEARRVSQDVERFIHWATKVYRMATTRSSIKS